uniref:C-type lectin domain-containing protein n=1 Tax=Parascaris univalens TaxID=6257 RepID=A0A915A960_PARUN
MNETIVIILLLAFISENVTLKCSNGGFLSSAFQRCYHFIPKLLTNFDAQRRCETFNGALLVLNSSDEAQIVTAYAKYGFDEIENISSYWIGSRFMDEQYRTLKRFEKLRFFNWDENEPSAEADGNCISSSLKTGRWSSEPCHLPKVSVCTTDATKSCKQPFRHRWNESSSRERPATVLKKLDVLKCGNNSIYIDSLNGCYRFIEETQSFMNAEKQCRTSHGGHLTKIDSRFKMLLLKDYAEGIFSMNVTKYWIGVSRIYGIWSWVDGSTVEYTNWKQGYPSSELTEQCVAADDNTAQWINLSCFGNKLPFICEDPLEGTDDC